MSTTEGMISVGDLSSSLQRFGWPDYLVFMLMLIVCAAIGVYFGFLEDKSKSTKSRNAKGRRSSEAEALDYLVGGRRMQVFPVSMSLVASFISGISLLGTSTEVYVYGTRFAFTLISVCLSTFITWYVILPVFHDLQLTSTYEYLEMRFNKKIRLFGSVLFVIGTVFWLPIVIYVPALAFNQVTGVNIHIITPIVCVVCIFYTSMGGLKAVVWTDVIQSFVMLGAIIIVIVKGTMNVGGIGEVFRRNAESGRLEAPELTFDPTVRFSVFSVSIGALMHWLQTSATNQVMIQRYLAVPTLRDARKALVIFTAGYTILMCCCLYNGLLIFATYYKCDPLTTKLAKAQDQLVPLLVMDTLGIYPGLPGLFVAGVFSAALSSLSTGLNSLSAVVLEDFCKPFVSRPLNQRQTALTMRSVVVLFGALCVALVFVIEKLGMVLQLSMTLGAITHGPLFGMFLIGILIPWFNAKSTLFGSLASFCVMAWICIKAQIAILTKELTFPTKPVTTEGCTYNFDPPKIPLLNSTIFDEIPQKEIYHMSFMWYTCLGCILVIVFAGLASLVFGFLDSRDADPALLAPFMRKYIKPRKYLSVQPDIKERNSVIKAYDVNETMLS